MQQLQIHNNNNNLYKGYKVTLYTDSLRETALCAIYINGPNLGTQRGWCEYVHYSLVFDRCIIDGGSAVNVISEATCHKLGLDQWEPCLFWLRMDDTRSVRSIGLI